jgi:hypothetical protein
MGVQKAGHLTKQEASDLISSEVFLQSVDMTDRGDWHTERLFLYPELYAFELREHLNSTLTEVLHAYVRSRIVGASEKLTKTRIQHVMLLLTKEDTSWWHSPHHETVFFERLKQVYPGCCDGRTPERTHQPPRSVAAESFYQGSTTSGKGAGCLVVLSLCLLFIALSALLKSR